MEDLLIRDYDPDDLPALVEILNEEWHFDIYGNNWVVLAEIFLREYIRRSEFVRVAVFHGEVAGVVTAGVHSEVGADPCTDPGAEEGSFVADQKTLDRTDEYLRSMNDLTGLGELILIIISRKVRGKHIGLALTECASNYLKAQGCEGMHISTDTDCNFGFYEHLGARLLSSGECMCQGKPITRFLYRLDF